MQLAIQLISDTTADSPVTVADPGPFASFNDLLQTVAAEQPANPASSSKLPLAAPAPAATSGVMRNTKAVGTSQVSSRKSHASSKLSSQKTPALPVVAAPNVMPSVAVPPASWTLPVMLPQTSSPTTEDIADGDVGRSFQFHQSVSRAGNQSVIAASVANSDTTSSQTQSIISEDEVLAASQRGTNTLSGLSNMVSAAVDPQSPASSLVTTEALPISTRPSIRPTSTSAPQISEPINDARPQTSSAGKRNEPAHLAGHRANAMRSAVPAQMPNSSAPETESVQGEAQRNAVVLDLPSPALPGSSRPNSGHLSTSTRNETASSLNLAPQNPILPAEAQMKTGPVTSETTPTSASPLSSTPSAVSKRDNAPSAAVSSPGAKPIDEGDFADQVSRLASAKSQNPAPDQSPLGARENTKVLTPIDAGSDKAGSQMTTASAAPELQNARLVQTSSRSEMRVDLHSQDFGSISVHSTLKRDSVSTQITLQDSQLSTALTTHVHEIEQKLNKDHGLRASVSVSAQDTSSSSSDQQQQKPPSAYRRSPDPSRKEAQNGSVAPVPAQASHLANSSTQSSAWAGNQVDLRI